MRTFRGGALAAALIMAAAAGCTGTVQAEQAKVAAASLPSVGTYTLDPPHTFIYFAAQHKIIGKVRGRFDKMTGTIVVTKDPAACTAGADPGKPSRVGFHATAAVKRADFGMKRELLAEIGSESSAPDVWIEIDAEALEAVAPKPPAS
jgi:polyisoprenoid-binding protein YceI